MSNITFDDFKKLEIRIGKIISGEKVEGADRLLRLEVDFGEGPSIDSAGSPQARSGRLRRQIVSGIAQFYKPEELIEKEFVFLVNLEPRKFRGAESQGMILAAEDNGKPVLLEPDKEVKVGSIVK